MRLGRVEGLAGSSSCARTISYHFIIGMSAAAWPRRGPHDYRRPAASVFVAQLPRPSAGCQGSTERTGFYTVLAGGSPEEHFDSSSITGADYLYERARSLASG